MENNTGLNPNMAPVNEELDWNSDISNDGQDYVILPEGEHVFQVVDLEKGRHGGSPKLPPCPKATLTLEVRTADGVARVKHNLFLHRTTERFLCEFFRSIGMKAKGIYSIGTQELRIGKPHIVKTYYIETSGWVYSMEEPANA